MVEKLIGLRFYFRFFFVSLLITVSFLANVRHLQSHRIMSYDNKSDFSGKTVVRIQSGLELTSRFFQLHNRPRLLQRASEYYFSFLRMLRDEVNHA